jgi:hypothetical protein
MAREPELTLSGRERRQWEGRMSLSRLASSRAFCM